MSGEPARRTPTGRSLRLVSPASDAHGPEDDEGLWLELPPQRRSVGVGRHWVVRVAAEQGVTGMANQVVELLASELLANAVLHGSGDGPIRVAVDCTETVIRVAVTDSLPQRPVVLHPEPIAPAGRGMAIVEAMSNRWGVEPHTPGGKTVWFEIDLDEY